MKDKLGIYYNPTMQDNDMRMYVRRVDGEIQFRLYNKNFPEVWDRHHWMPYAAIERAAEMFREKKQSDRNPLALYDINVAERLLMDEGQ